LKRGLERAGFASAAFAVTTPQGGRQIPLTPESIAPCFPQLQILEVLGQGGMGTVFKARQLKLDRLVAVKIIRPETASDPAFAERFMREAKTLARLNHPGIVSVHDFGEVSLLDPGAGSKTSGSTLFFFIMEYVEGANLRQLMQSAPISPSLTLGIIQQVCDALQYAHEEGVVHRDIKPENIMLDSKGRVKIADFGLAKLADQSGEDWTLTGTHQVMGTPRYMAPEQLAGSRNVDHRVDIYSLAVVFYEMLTGILPVGHFAFPSKKIAVDTKFDDVILRAMASEPGERFQSVQEFRLGVDEIVTGGGLSGINARSADSPGFSTILDRQVAGAWSFFTGREAENSENSRGSVSAPMPYVGIAVLGIAGLIASFLVESSWSRETDFVLRLISLVGFVLIAAFWTAMPAKLRATAWASGVSSLLSLTTMISVLVGVAASRIGGVAFDRLYVIPIVCVFSLTLLGLSGMRRVLFRHGGVFNVSRSDSVVVTRKQLEQGILPDICMISGVTTYNRVAYTSQYHLKWSEAWSLTGNSLSGIPGALLHMLAVHTLHISCPINSPHEGHWRNRNVYANVGWMLIPLLGLPALMIGLQFPDVPGQDPGVAAMNLGMTLGVTMSIVGLLCYLVPVIWMPWHMVRIEQISDGTTSSGQVSFSRVCLAFASEVRRRQAALNEKQVKK
jgi:serine/threonine protein kinase